LENAVERALVLRRQTDCLDREDLPVEILDGGTLVGPSGLPPGPALPDTGIDFFAWEKTLLKDALQKAGGNRSRAARLLGMTRQTLLYRLRKFGLVAPMKDD
jgi:transcriptional regulator with PAS, ATPase and Fis domain